MAETTGISWCEATHNEWKGCQETGSPACVGCYARELISVRWKQVEWGPKAERKMTSDANLLKPLHWNKRPLSLKAPEGTKPFIFGGSLMDFADNKAPAGAQEHLFGTIWATPNLQWLMLTKRIGNVVELAERVGGWPPNAALMVTAVTQQEWDRDVAALIRVATQLKPTFIGVSMEPLYEHVDVSALIKYLNWVIVGGGTDQGKFRAYDSDPDWFRDVQRKCAAFDVAFHMKQMTRKAPVPPDLRVQERPYIPVAA